MPVYFPEDWCSFEEIFFEAVYEKAFKKMPLPSRWLDLGCHAGYFSLWIAWLLFLGSDDLVYSKSTFKNIFSAPIPKDVGLLYGSVLVMNETGFARAGQVYDGKFSMDKLLKQNICQQAIFYRRTLFERLGKYNIRYPVCADWEMNMRFFARTKVLYLDLIVARFRGGGLSSMDNYFHDPIFKDIHFLRKKYSGRTYYLAWIKDYIRRILHKL